MDDLDMNKLSEDERVELQKLYEKMRVTAFDGGEPTRDIPPPPPPPPTKEDIARANSSPPGAGREFGEFATPNPPAVKRLLDPTEWVDKAVRGMEATGRANYEAGIRSPKKDPIKAGIDAQGKYENEMKKPEVLKRREDGLRATSMEEWASMAETVGAENLVRGYTSRRPKLERRIGKLQPLLASHLTKIDALPNVTDADREKRMIENLRGLKGLKGKAK